MDKSKIILKRMIDKMGFSSNKELAEYLDTPYDTLNNWIKRDSIPMKIISLMVHNGQCGYDWLLTGKKEPINNKELISNDNNLVEITYYENIVASAGGGAFNDDEAHTLMAFDKEFLKVHLGLTSFNNIHIITATGDSMEPTISPSELLFVSPIENEAGYIKEGGIYIIQCDDSILVKRVSKNNFSKEITLISDNTIYPPQTIKLDDFNTCNILGRVIGQFNGL